MKKLLSLFLAMLLLLVITPIDTKAYYWDSPENAGEVRLNEWYSRDMYTDNWNTPYYLLINLPVDGIITLESPTIELGDGSYNSITATFYDMDMNVVFHRYTGNKFYDSVDNFVRVGLPKGQYYVLLDFHTEITWGYINYQYIFRFEDTNFAEKEDNYFTLNSQQILQNTYYRGFTDISDGYKYVFENDSSLRLSIKSDDFYFMQLHEGMTIKAYQLDENGEFILMGGLPFGSFILSADNESYYYDSTSVNYSGDVIYIDFEDLNEENIEYNFKVEELAPTVGIQMEKSPTKVHYVKGENLDIYGSYIRVNKADGTSFVRDIGQSMIVDYINAFNPYGAYGPQTINVNFHGFTTSFDVYLNRFSDVRYGNWAYDLIESIASQGIVGGFQDGTFKPNANLTRAEAAKMIVGALGLSSTGATSNFSDVSSSNWAYGFVSAAFEAGVIKGYEDGTFRPNGKISRAEIATMLQRAFEITQGSQVRTFSDVPTTSWAYTSVNNLSSNGIINGYQDGTFKLNNLVTRAEFAKMLKLSMDY